MKNHRSPEVDVFESLVRAADTVTALSQTGLKGAGLTPSRYGVLAALHESGPLSPKVLAARILRSPGNLTLVLENLDRDGLVKRVSDPKDRRRIIVSLTETGRKLVAKVQPGHRRRIDEAMKRLTEREQETLQKICRKLVPAE